MGLRNRPDCLAVVVLLALVVSTFFYQRPDFLHLDHPFEAHFDGTGDDVIVLQSPRPKTPDFPPSETLAKLTSYISALSEADARWLRDFPLHFETNRSTAQSQCGHWQTPYARMHAKAREAETLETRQGIVHVARPAYLAQVATGMSGGLADRMKGVVTTFAIALALNRPFYVHWLPNDPMRIEHVFQSPSIDWSLPELPDPASERVKNLRHMVGEVDYFPAWSTNPDIINAVQYGDREHLNKLFDKPLTVLETNAGSISGGMGSNAFVGTELRKIGLTRENVYSCIMNYLFRPLPYTLSQIALFHAVLQHPSVFSISVQVRTADHHMLDPNRDRNNIRPSYPYFECAIDLAISRLQPRHKAIVLFISTDHAGLRDGAAADINKLFPQKPDVPVFALIADFKPQHIGTEGGHRNTPEDAQFAMQTSIFDNYVMDGADMRIISEDSGYGVLAGLRSWSHSPNSVVLLHKVGNPWLAARNSQGKDCDDPEAPLNLRQLSSLFGFA